MVALMNRSVDALLNDIIIVPEQSRADDIC